MHLLTRKISDTDKIDTSATLDCATRLRSRSRIRLDNGDEACLNMVRGTQLSGGDLISDDQSQFVVRIHTAMEAVSVALCSDPRKLAISCYHLGNRHVTLQIESDRVIYLHDDVLDDLLIRLGLIVKHENLPFEPVAGAYETG